MIRTCYLMSAYLADRGNYTVIEHMAVLTLVRGSYGGVLQTANREIKRPKTKVIFTKKKLKNKLKPRNPESTLY